MKVSELIEELKKCPQDAEIYTEKIEIIPAENVFLIQQGIVSGEPRYKVQIT